MRVTVIEKPVLSGDDPRQPGRWLVEAMKSGEPDVRTATACEAQKRSANSPAMRRIPRLYVVAASVVTRGVEDDHDGLGQCSGMTPD
jgi:hypothetical protein